MLYFDIDLQSKHLDIYFQNEILNSNCSPYVVPFVCGVMFPQCTENSGVLRYILVFILFYTGE